MATDNRASRTNFDNVTSLGVSYNWEHDKNGQPCEALIGGEAQKSGEWIKRTKTLNIAVRNLDIANAGGSVVEAMAANQEKYTNDENSSIYVNGNYAGYGRLTQYSVSEGSQSNDVTSSLTYVIDNGAPGDSDTIDTQEDPVSRTSSITVSRDLVGKSYEISQSAGVDFGNDFDLITNSPLYSSDPEYKSVDGRLTLAENWVSNAIFGQQVDFSSYIDLSAYQTAGGWNLSGLQNGCSGVASNSSHTKNFINGGYSATRTTRLSYTGENLEPIIPAYQVNYTMAFSAREEGDTRCSALTMNGSVQGQVDNFGEGCPSISQQAESGYQEFVVGGAATGRLVSFFGSIKSALGGDFQGDLVPKILNLTKKECDPTLNQGAKNDGTIEFSFEMNNCPGNKTGAFPYTAKETTATSENIQECRGVSRNVTSITVAGSVQGDCGLPIDSSGNYPKWDSAEGEWSARRAAAGTTAIAAYSGAYPGKFKIKTESYGHNPYAANGDYSVTYSDAPLSDECGARSSAGVTGCFAVELDVNAVPAKPNRIYTKTSAGLVTEIKGNTLPTKSVDVQITSPSTGDCSQLYTDYLDEAKTQLNDNKPACVLQRFNWTFSKRYGQATSMKAATKGIDL